MTLEILLELLALIVPLFHLTGLALAAHAILSARTSSGAIAWALSLVFIPYFAILPYLVFGRSRFHGYIEARRTGDRRIDHFAKSLVSTLLPARADLCPATGRIGVLEQFTVLPFTRGNRGHLLVDGTATFDAIFAAIDEARHYLLIQFFIVRDDALGRELQRRLIARAKAGIKVYFLYDEIGCFWLPRKYWTTLRAHGVRAEPFNTRRGWWNPFQINFRNHRKIVVSDGREAYVGGHNVGIEYLGQAKRFGHWRDTHVELTGPAVAAVQLSFLEDWHWATRELLELSPPISSPVSPHPPSAALPVSHGGASNVLVIPSGPADDVNTAPLMFLTLISAARHRLWITSPYFVPDETVYDALQLAALRGVDVRIMLPAKPDHVLVYLSSFTYLESAENVGVKFYRYEAGFLHQKVILVDDDLAAVGTANLDNRSLRLNFELTVLFADRAFAAELSAMLEKDFAQCRRATLGDLRRRGLPFRVAVRLARLFSPIQ
jgi:cardiolipin synthase